MKNIFKWIAAVVVLSMSGLSGYAQIVRGGEPASNDTVTFVLYDNGLSFNSRRTIVFTDKHSVDSLVNILANDANAVHYHIIYQKIGQEAKEIAFNDFKKLDKAGIFQITIAYRKRALSADHKPLYILSSK